MMPAYVLLGQLYTEKFDFENMYNSFADAEKLGLGNPALYFEWGKSFEKFNKLDDAKSKLLKAFEMAGYTEEEVKTKFGALYTAFQFGAPPHAGIAPGVDRMIMLLTNSETIRDVIAFPMNSKAQDLMMGAPGTVSKEQLKDVHIKLDVK